MVDVMFLHTQTQDGLFKGLEEFVEIKDTEVEENGWILYKYELWLYMEPLVT